MKEERDVTAEMVEVGTVEVECPTCHTKRTLFYNGGELDWAECDHTEWQLEHRSIVLVTTQKTQDSGLSASEVKE